MRPHQMVCIGVYPKHSVLVLDEPVRMFDRTFKNASVLPAFQYLPLVQEMPAIKSGGTFSVTNIEICCLVPNMSETSIVSCQFEIFAIIRALTGKAVEVEAHSKVENGVLISGQAADESTSFATSIFKSSLNFGELNILGVSKSDRLNIAIRSDQTAQPGKIELFDKNGSSQSWPVHQNSYRLIWLNAHRMLSQTSHFDENRVRDLQADWEMVKAHISA